MNDKQHLYNESIKLLENISLRRLFSPRKTLEDEIWAHRIRALYYMANGDKNYIAELEEQMRLELFRLDKYGDTICLEDQNDLILFSLAVNKMDYAKKFASISIEYDQSHKFDILLNCKLRMLLKVKTHVKEPEYKALKSEIGLFAAIDNILTHQDVNWSGVESYWKATRLKRYEHTAFSDVDLFSKALHNIEIAFNKAL